MSAEDERPAAPDLFTAPPANPHQHPPTPGTYQYPAAGTGGAAHQFAPAARAYVPRPVTHDRKRPGWVRRSVPYVAVIWGGLAIVLTVVDDFLFSFSLTYPRGGQLFGFLLAIAMVVGGGQEIASQHLRRVRYLPWLMALEVAAVIFLIVVSQVARPPYPASVRAGLLNGCEAHGGDASYCGCVLSWFESNVSFAQYLADFGATATGASRADMSKAVASCTR
jgi:hypothetical protein